MIYLIHLLGGSGSFLEVPLGLGGQHLSFALLLGYRLYMGIPPGGLLREVPGGWPGFN